MPKLETPVLHRTVPAPCQSLPRLSVPFSVIHDRKSSNILACRRNNVTHKAEFGLMRSGNLPPCLLESRILITGVAISTGSWNCILKMRRSTQNQHSSRALRTSRSQQHLLKFFRNSASPRVTQPNTNSLEHHIDNDSLHKVRTMLSSTRSLIWGGLLALASFATASPVATGPLPIAIRDSSPPSSLENRDYNTSSLLSPVVFIPPTIQQDLTSLLSPSALVILPSSPSFPQYTSRWSLNTRTNSPSYAVIVIPASERDVSLTIQYANAHSIPFLATTGTHGTWHGLSKLQGGMAIWTRNLTKMEFAADGNSATLGGGLRGNDVIPALWARGKQTTTGSCRCVSLLGPALGGGHGWLQGQYGLGADQILSARVVLANGTAVKASNTENSDLFWALRGAGHNFGVVTEVEYKLYDAVRPNWAYQSFTFTQDRLEDVYRVHNEVMRNQNQYVVYWSLWRLVPEVDAVNVSLFFHFFSFPPPFRSMSTFSVLSTPSFPSSTSLTQNH